MRSEADRLAERLDLGDAPRTDIDRAKIYAPFYCRAIRDGERDAARIVAPTLADLLNRIGAVNRATALEWDGFAAWVGRDGVHFKPVEPGEL